MPSDATTNTMTEDISDMELLRSECVRLQAEIGKLRAKQFTMAGGPVPDMDGGSSALQQRRVGRIVMLEHENNILRHRLRVEEARSRTLLVDAARRVGEKVFHTAATSTEDQVANGMMNVNTADLMLLLCAVPPAPELEAEALLNSDAGQSAPVARCTDR